ncbi:MAG: nucleotidyltransferase domain-containing protein [Deltaproteobacteria bacterium]|nr:MAG: nucleotidyltransferase domain-containing protein [Deltaproteobacteria bacterium]
MSIDESLIQEIVQRILSVACPKRIILFGSAATAEMSRDSDIDLLVVEDDPGNQRKESVRLRQRLTGSGYRFDVIVISTEWFDESKNVIGGIAYPAKKYVHSRQRMQSYGSRSMRWTANQELIQ